jgi:hypothetical protein
MSNHTWAVCTVGLSAPCPLLIALAPGTAPRASRGAWRRRTAGGADGTGGRSSRGSSLLLLLLTEAQSDRQHQVCPWAAMASSGRAVRTRGRSPSRVRERMGPTSSPCSFLISTRTRPGTKKSRGCILFSCRRRRASAHLHTERHTRTYTHTHTHLDNGTHAELGDGLGNVANAGVFWARLLGHAPPFLRGPLGVHVHGIDAHPPVAAPHRTEREGRGVPGARRPRRTACTSPWRWAAAVPAGAHRDARPPSQWMP